ncbi:MAG TPA: hypothetical protein VLR91_01340 [Thermodesulfobacteriota bacterium]|nr:hypothetical protein [Thermodesulfobacteriota bacterium]
MNPPQGSARIVLLSGIQDLVPGAGVAGKSETKRHFSTEECKRKSMKLFSSDILLKPKNQTTEEENSIFSLVFASFPY